MAASRSRTIRDSLVTLFEGMQLDGEPAFQQVKTHSKGKYEGFPFAVIIPDDVDNQPWSMGEHERSMQFSAIVGIEVKDDGSDIDQMLDLSDVIIDSIDKADHDGGFNVENGAYDLQAKRGEWDVKDLGAGPILIFLVHIAVTYGSDDY